LNYKNNLNTKNEENDKLIQENNQLKDEFAHLKKVKDENKNKNIPNNELENLQNKCNEHLKEKEKIKNEYEKLLQDYNTLIQENEKEKKKKIKILKIAK